MNIAGIAHLGNLGATAETKVKKRERSVTDFSDFTNRQRVHDDFGRFKSWNIRLKKLDRH